MKVIIWIACAILQSITYATIQGICSGAGIILGGLVSGLLAIATIGIELLWLAPKLCKKWDWSQAKKKADAAGMTLLEYGKHNLPEAVLNKLESYRGKPVEELKYQLKACVKAGKITKEQYTILLDEYRK